MAASSPGPDPKAAHRIGPPPRRWPIPERIVSREEFERAFDRFGEMADDEVEHELADVLGSAPTEQELASTQAILRRRSYQEYLSGNGVHPFTDPRTLAELSAQLRPVSRPDGTITSVLAGEPALPGFSPKQKWTARDAMTVRSRMVGLLGSGYGMFEASEATTQYLAALRIAEPGITDRQIELVLSRELHRRYLAWSDPDTLLLLADADFALMVRAAMLTSPKEMLAADELLCPSGILLFSSPTAFPEIAWDEPMRGIHWDLQGTELDVEGLMDGSQVVRPDTDITPEQVDTYLASQSSMRFPLTGPDAPATEDLNGPSMLVMGLLRSITAIARSPRTTVSERSAQDQKRGKKRRAARAGRDLQGSVRLLSLRAPDEARMEYESAAGTSAGRGMRDHWVRGHWRRQWYPRLGTDGEHRTIWIDGFPKGDPARGTMDPSARVYRP